MLLVGILIQALLGWIGAQTWLTAHNTLAANGNWISTKTRLERGLGGAYSFVRETQSLAGGRLDLTAWHGYQEVLWHREVEGLRSLEFDFHNHPDAATAVILDRGEDGPFRALSLSSHKGRPSRLYEVGEDGGFLGSTPLSTPAFAGGVDHRVELLMAAGRLVVNVDGQMAGEFAFQPRPRQRFGFRGSSHASSIDNVVATFGDGQRARDSFSAPAGASRIKAGAGGGIVLLNLALFGLLAGTTGAGPRALGFYFLMVNLTLLVIGVLAFFFVVERSTWYPGLDKVLEEREAYHRKGEVDKVLEEVTRRGESLPGLDRYRILFVGASQTWGAGAARSEETFVATLERLLNTTRPGKRRVACINAGVSSTRAVDLLPLLRDQWLALEPGMVVINLSSNDRATPLDEFAADIGAMIDSSLAVGARAVLVKEPNNRLTSTHRTKHFVLDRVGMERGVPVIDLQEYLQRATPTGFLWWDKVHLTSYGQKLVAQELYRQLLPLLDGS